MRRGLAAGMSEQASHDNKIPKFRSVIIGGVRGEVEHHGVVALGWSLPLEGPGHRVGLRNHRPGTGVLDILDACAVIPRDLYPAVQRAERACLPAGLFRSEEASGHLKPPAAEVRPMQRHRDAVPLTGHVRAGDSPD